MISLRYYQSKELSIFINFFLKFEAAIEAAGYTWFLENVVNNRNGGWPLALGSDRFVEADFDVAEVAGIS